MKLNSKIAYSAASLLLAGSTVSAQSLNDAKKAIDAEQYQKAKSMLKNLTNTQATNADNFFYLGWVYALQDYSDSAKAVFNKGIAANPKSALNYAGLGAVARLEKDRAAMTTNFNQATTLAGKDSKPFVYVGKAYLLPVAGATAVPAADANAAIAVLSKGLAVNSKDADVDIALGDAYRSQLKSNEAYKYYSDALTLNGNSAVANVSVGVLWKYANNFEDAEKQFQKALSVDPNFGPAYREWAETDLRWAQTDPKMASAKIKEAADNYRKYLSLTDLSVESRMRYADFLLLSGDYKTLQTEAAALSSSANSNLRIYRYLGYSAYENGDYQAGLTAMNNWLSKADPKRVIPRDYLYLGRLQLKTGADSLGIQSLRKAYSLDSTNADVFAEIAKNYYGKKQYAQAGQAYESYINNTKGAKLQDYLNEGLSYYYAYDDKTHKPADTVYLAKADSAFSHIEKVATTPIAAVALYRAYVNDTKDADRQNIKGLAKPFYEKYIQIVTTKGVTDADKKNLANAYAYLGTFAQYKEKDMAKATENFNKAYEYDPTNRQAKAFLKK
ncbi:tetratricopeptide repeat protein [Mucilaginibacter ginkgonis]|uniref:Tetratricopeptide repeat protein n=1 Tax=Mucilaginibacter ginkgonis TaxID=2682091 RepID=A0A6I4I304_9SPHI|nr:hypothetical protein [Mucilaginibacter ginkgonis]QQL49676.1 hypothetical protein GO620_016130 [Mucilaginibacter ginkgonis]